MRMKNLLVVAIATLLSFSGAVNANSASFMKVFGSPGDDYALGGVQQTLDGGFVIFGLTNGVGAGSYDVLLVKFDASGAIQWTKTVGGGGGEVARSGRQTSDGGYIVSGDTDTFTGVGQLLLTKLDSTGAFQWASSLGSTSDSAAGQSVKQTSDGGYIVSGIHGGAIGGIGLLKYDASGNLQWLRRASGTNHYGASVQQTSDGGYIVAGSKQDGGLSLIKFDTLGNIQWAQLSGGSGYSDNGNAVQQTSDGGYVVAGMTASFGAGGQDALLLKYDGSGTLQWARTAGGAGDDDAFSVQQTTDGGYVVAGHTRSFGTGTAALFVVKFDSSGTLQWGKAGGGSVASQPSVQQTTDGGYVISDSTMDFGAVGVDLLLIKTDANGNIEDCTDWSSVNPNIGTSFFSSPASHGNDSPGLSASNRTLSVNTLTLTSTQNAQCTGTVAPLIDTVNSSIAVNEGTTAANTGTYTDPNSNDNVTISASVGGISKGGTNSGTWSWSFPTTDGPAQSQQVTITANDGNGGIATTTFSLAVNNVFPSIPAVGLNPTPLSENNTVTLSGLLSDPGILDGHTVTINWGDASLNSSVVLGPGQLSFGAMHLYPDDNPTNTPSDTYPITISVIDKDNGTGSVGAFLPVNNVAPVISTVSGPINPLALGTPATVTANFTDVGTEDTHTCTFAWDDGQPSTSGTVTETAASGSCTDTRTYTTAGVYTVSVKVKDDDTGSATKTFEFVVVYDPTAGFVTGGGWINSPAGAYVADPSLTGKANFGFVSKYKKGANTPEGQTEFQFQVGNFNFHSSVYDWLVVAGPKVQYKGTGTVNGTGSYGFRLTARDGQQAGGGGVDKFRIKIWDKNNYDAVVYDNVLGASDDIDTASPQAIGGGSIVIHNN